MNPRPLLLIALLAACPLLGVSKPSSTDAATQAPLRFEQEIRAFAEADRAKPPVPGGIMFVGSSTFRQWTNVAEMMAPLPVLNRAFGGSRTSDQLARFEQVVSPYAPKVIVYYCGSNDLKADDAPDAIFERFKAFSERTRRAFPEVRLVFVFSTRSPDRVAKWDRVDHYNGLVRAYCAATPNHTFIDINPALFDAEGKPRLELYQEDKLHFHPPAYVEFAAIIKPVLTRVWDDSTASARALPAKPSDSSVALAVNKAILEGRTGRFIAERYESEAGGMLPFQIFIPTHVARDKRHPLLVFLHGAGELGDDNQSQLVGFPREFVVPETQAKHPCFAIAPQCPKSDAWSSFPEYPASARASASPTAATRLVIELVERLVAGGRIDPARIYVTGLSLGGEGTFDIVSRRPDLFAAAVPVCGIADVARASSMARVPFWIFHGDQDDINPVKYSRDAYHALTANGAKPIYTEYQGAGHDIWKRAYNEPGLIPWLFKQHR